MLRSWHAVCLALALAVTACSKSDMPPKQAMPGIGRLSGVQLSIPAEYQFFPVEYDGDEIWARPPKRHAPGPDVPIRSFSLLLHLPDFGPRIKGNEVSWLGQSGRDARNDEWIQVGVKPADGIGNDPAQWFSGLIQRRMEMQIARIHSKANWYFRREPKPVYGLINEKKIGPDYSKISIENNETFYDPKRATTYIVCTTGPGGADLCQHEFIIAELGALVTVDYARTNLREWGNIQSNVRHIVLSFRI